MYIRLVLWLGLTAVLAVIVVSALLTPVPSDGVRGGAEPRAALDPATRPDSAKTDLEPAAGRPFVLSADERGQVVAVPAGTEARIEVHASEPVSVQLGEDGPIELAEPGTPAAFPVFGDAGAEGPIRVLEPDRDIGRVKVAD